MDNLIIIFDTLSEFSLTKSFSSKEHSNSFDFSDSWMEHYFSLESSDEPFYFCLLMNSLTV